jgi:hypothetical protein
LENPRFSSLTRALRTGCLLALVAASTLGCDSHVTTPGEKVPTPYIQPSGGAVSAGTTVTIVCADTNALIRYTQGAADVAAPTAATGSPYDADHRPTVDSACTIKAMAYKEGCIDSDVAVVDFTISPGTGGQDVQVPTPRISPAGGEVAKGSVVTISCSDASAVIRYTLGASDIAEPGIDSGFVYDPANKPTVDSACTIKVRAYKDGCIASELTSADFSIAVTPASLSALALPDLALALGASEATYYDMGDIWGMDPGYATSIGVESGLDSAGQRASRFSLAGFGCGFIALKYTGLTPGATVRLAFDADVDLSAGSDSDPEGFYVFAGEASAALPADGFGLGEAKRCWNQDGSGEGASTGGWAHYEDLSACASSSGEYLVCLRLNDWVRTSTRAFSGALRALSVSEAPAGQAPVKRLAFPILSPDGGWIDRPTDVTISLAKPLAGAVIRYTLDGSAPTAGSSAYSGPIALGLGKTVVSAATFREGEEASALSRATYRRADRPAGNLIENGSFDSGLDFWQYGGKPASTPPVDYTLAVEDGAAHFGIASPGSKAWHIMLRYWASQGVTLEKGHRYALSFKAKSNRDRSILVVFEEDNRDLNGDGSTYSRYNGVGGSDTAVLSPAWRDYRIEFVMQNPDDDGAKFDLQLGAATGDVWLDDLALADVTSSADASTIGVTINETLLPDGYFSIFRSPRPKLWVAVDISDGYYREIVWTDKNSGAYPGETDVLLSFYAADRTTAVKLDGGGGLDGADIIRADSGPVPVKPLASGRYYIKLEEKNAGEGIDCRVAMRVRS